MKKRFISISILSIFLFSGCNQRAKSIHVPIMPKTNPIDINTSEVKKEDTQIVAMDIGVKVEDVQIDNNTTQKEINTTEVKKSKIQRSPFPLAEYKNLKKYGESTLSGVMFLQKDGSKIFAQNAKLFLHPLTSYSKEWYEKSYIEGYEMSEADKKMYNYLLYTTTDGDGNFSFFAVSKGKYYVVGTMICSMECGYEKPTSIVIAQEIEIGEGAKKSMKLYKAK